MSDDMVNLKVQSRFIDKVTKFIEELIEQEDKDKRAEEYYKRGAEFWNSKREYINDILAHSTDLNSDSFNWNQLVWQEIWLYASMAKPISETKDFYPLCERRGFNKEQKDFLKEAIEYMGIGWEVDLDW